MAQFCVYGNKKEASTESVPFLLDVQADLLDDLATRVVVPLVSASAVDKPIKHLNPRFEIEGRTVFMSTAELAGVPAGVLGRRVGSLRDRRDDIVAALDFLFLGF